MKIRPPGFGQMNVQSRAPRPARPAPEVSAKDTREAAEVEVQVSPAARLLSSQSGDPGGLPVDMALVEKVRQMLAADTYEIDEPALARAILDKELRWRPTR